MVIQPRERARCTFVSSSVEPEQPTFEKMIGVTKYGTQQRVGVYIEGTSTVVGVTKVLAHPNREPLSAVLY